MDEKKNFKRMLSRIFVDATATDAERAELKSFMSSGALSAAEINSAITEFIETAWRITIVDGVVSDNERRRLEEIVGVLGLHHDALPAEWRRAIQAAKT